MVPEPRKTWNNLLQLARKLCRRATYTMTETSHLGEEVPDQQDAANVRPAADGKHEQDPAPASARTRTSTDTNTPAAYFAGTHAAVGEAMYAGLWYAPPYDGGVASRCPLADDHHEDFLGVVLAELLVVSTTYRICARWRKRTNVMVSRAVVSVNPTGLLRSSWKPTLAFSSTCLMFASADASTALVVVAMPANMLCLSCAGERVVLSLEVFDWKLVTWLQLLQILGFQPQLFAMCPWRTYVWSSVARMKVSFAVMQW